MNIRKSTTPKYSLRRVPNTDDYTIHLNGREVGDVSRILGPTHSAFRAVVYLYGTQRTDKALLLRDASAPLINDTDKPETAKDVFLRITRKATGLAKALDWLHGFGEEE